MLVEVVWHVLERYLKTWTFEHLIPNKLVHSVITAGMLSMMNKKLDFVFFDPLNFKYVSIAKLKILIFLDFDITSW